MYNKDTKIIYSYKQFNEFPIIYIGLGLILSDEKKHCKYIIHFGDKKLELGIQNLEITDLTDMRNLFDNIFMVIEIWIKTNFTYIHFNYPDCNFIKNKLKPFLGKISDKFLHIYNIPYNLSYKKDKVNNNLDNVKGWIVGKKDNNLDNKTEYLQCINHLFIYTPNNETAKKITFEMPDIDVNNINNANYVLRFHDDGY